MAFKALMSLNVVIIKGLIWTVLATDLSLAQNWTYIPTSSITGMEYQLIAYGEEANHTALQDYCTEPSSNFRPKTNRAIFRVMQRFRGYFKYSCRIWVGIFRNGSAWIDRNGDVATPYIWNRGQPQLSDMNAFIYLHNKSSRNLKWTGTHNFTPMERDYFICQREHVCKLGYAKDPPSHLCFDIDECWTSLDDPCPDEGFECENLNGSYQCVCKLGYSRSLNQCLDIDECAKKSKNKCEQGCINTKGSFHCICQEGLQLAADKKTCEDIDECTGDHTCAQKCTNTQGSFVCSCFFGFKPSIDDEGKCIKEQNLDLCLANDTRFHCPCLLGMRITKDQSTGEILCQAGCIEMKTPLHIMIGIGIGIVLASILYDSWGLIMRNAERYRKHGSKSTEVSPIKLSGKQTATVATGTVTSDETTTTTGTTVTFKWTNIFSEKFGTASIMSSRPIITASIMSSRPIKTIRTQISSMFNLSVADHTSTTTTHSSGVATNQNGSDRDDGQG